MGHFLWTLAGIRRRIIGLNLIFIFITLSPRLLGFDSFQRLQTLKFQQISNPGSLANNWINNIIKDGDGFIWFATENGIARYDGT